jgi:hypothetical protein
MRSTASITTLSRAALIANVWEGKWFRPGVFGLNSQHRDLGDGGSPIGHRDCHVNQHPTRIRARTRLAESTQHLRQLTGQRGPVNSRSTRYAPPGADNIAAALRYHARERAVRSRPTPSHDDFAGPPRVHQPVRSARRPIPISNVPVQRKEPNGGFTHLPEASSNKYRTEKPHSKDAQ